MKLVIGNKNYSSWSLRPWLLLRSYHIPFEEIRIPLYTGDYHQQILAISPAGRVPVLLDRGLTVWDSLSICEYVSEEYLHGRGWPVDKGLRAEARSCAAEMHGGFHALRNHLPMNCRAHHRRVAITPELQLEIQRIDTLWSELRNQHAHSGPWLFGKFSIVDCMFAPVVFRFSTYDIGLSDEASRYRSHSLDDPSMREWIAAAKMETETIPENEIGLNSD